MAKKSPPPSPQPGVMTHLPPEFSPDADAPPLPELPGSPLNLPELGTPEVVAPFAELQPPRLPREVALALPWVDDELDGYTPRKVDLHLTAEQAIALRRLTEGLDACQARLDNGTRVTSGPLAVRWLLEHAGIRADADVPADDAADAAA